MNPKGSSSQYLRRVAIPVFQTVKKETTSEQSLLVWKFHTDLILLLLLTCRLLLPFNGFAYVIGT